MGSIDRAHRRAEQAHWAEMDYQYRQDCKEKGVKPYDPNREIFEHGLSPFWGAVLRKAITILVVGVLMFVILLAMGHYGHL